MKNFHHLLLLLFLLCYKSDLFGQTEYFVKVDQNSGKYSIIKSIPTMYFIDLSNQTFNETDMIYYFVGAEFNKKSSLYSIDAYTGKTLSKPDFPKLANPKDNIVEFKYDMNTKKIYGLHWNDSLKTEFLVSINPDNGKFSIIDSIPGVKWIKHQSAVFDEKNHLFIFIGGNIKVVSRLYSINVITGQIVSMPLFPNLSDPKDILSDLRYNNTTKKLHGILWDNSQGNQFLVTIDSGSGKINLIDSLSGVRWIKYPRYATTIDENKNHIIFCGIEKNSKSYLYQADLTNGKIIHKVLFPQLCNYADNLYQLHFSKNSNILYSLHWEHNSYFTRLRDTSLCSSSKLKLNVPNGSKWSNGDTGRILYPKTSGYYSYFKISPCDSVVWKDTLFINLEDQNSFIRLRDTFVCQNTGILLNVPSGSKWSNGDTGKILYPKTGKNYSFVYNSPCGRLLRDTVFIGIAPLANFSFEESCIFKPTQFTFTGMKNSLPVTTTFSWDFAGKTTSNTENPSTLLDKPGRIKVILTLTSSLGCTDSIIKEVEVKPKSKADFITNDVCESDSAIFENMSEFSSSYYWKFGDGFNSMKATPKHLYLIDGVTKTFNVTLVAVSGCSDSTTKALTINANPISNFTYKKNAGDIELIASQNNNSKYKWKFNDIDSVIGTTPNYTYSLNKPGLKRVCLHVTNLAGCISETCQDVSLGFSYIPVKNGFKIYPNPNNSSFNIEIENHNEDMSIEVFDMLGNLASVIDVSSGKLLYSVDLKVSDGIYLVKVRSGKFLLIQKVAIFN